MRSRWNVAVVGAGAVHIHVALRDVIENARTADCVSEGGIASAVAGGAIFGGRQTVIDNDSDCLGVRPPFGLPTPECRP